MAKNAFALDISGREHLEEWRSIPGFEGLYEASNLGRVRSLDHGRRKGRVLKQRFLSRREYVVVTMSRNGKYRDQFVHRMVLKAFCGEPPPGYECCHNNGNPTDNQLENLRWDSRNENSVDQVRHGTHHHVRKTHCPKGHPYDETNTYHHPNGGRICIECRRIGLREHYRRKKAA